ncbi:hypothetical protein ACFY8S_01515 [Streptomyces hygroscopicus]|uniref:hypothetical protein n=1 Tax=Streptomyces hygroscopicus TaxID=1912 RepID=UPI00369045E7
MSPRRTPPPLLTIHVEAGPPRPDWCRTCKAHTRFTGDVLLLTPAGVAIVGAYAGCEICDEPEEVTGRG